MRDDSVGWTVPVTRTAEPSTASVVRALVRLKWSLLRNGLRGSTQLRIQTGLSLVFSTGAGLLACALTAGIGRGFANADAAVVVLLPAVVVATALLAAAAGVESTVDVRMLAATPVTPSAMSTGVLAAATVGPPALVGALSGLGLAIGYGGGGPASWAVLVLVVVGWWATLLLVSRSSANALGALTAGRWRHLGQFLAAIAAVGLWLVLQVGSRITAGWTGARWMAEADRWAWTPPGQLGRAFAAVADRPGAALLHLSASLVWLPALWWIHTATTGRLATTSARGGDGARVPRTGRAGVRSGILGWLPSGPVGSLTARTLRTKFRSPREAVNTVVALLLGVGALAALPLLGAGALGGPLESGDGRLVLTAGLLHFAVLFEGNNAYGYDGPALWWEVGAGADGGRLSRSKALSSLVVMAPAAVALVLLLALISGGWPWLPAGLLLVTGSILLATGASVLSAALAPFALPDSPNPLAAGDAGQGCLAGSVLMVGMIVLSVVSVPVALAVVWAVGRGPTTTAFVSLLAPVVGAVLLALALVAARALLGGREAELVAKVTPAR
jgi:hypothetical protein